MDNVRSVRPFIFINMRYAASDTNRQYDSPRHEIRRTQLAVEPGQLGLCFL